MKKKIKNFSIFNPSPTARSYLALTTWCIYPNSLFLFPMLPLHPRRLSFFFSPPPLFCSFLGGYCQKLTLLNLIKQGCQLSLPVHRELYAQSRVEACAIVGWLIKRAANPWLSQCSLCHFSNICLLSFQAITRANSEHVCRTLQYTLASLDLIILSHWDYLCHKHLHFLSARLSPEMSCCKEFS